MKPATKEAEAKVQTGLACPRCACRHMRVVYTRPRASQIIRVRECRHCGKRVLTRERAG